MTKPLVVNIPHNLGKEEAVRRLKSGMSNARSSFGGLTIVEEAWIGDHLDLNMSVLNQKASGAIDVADDHVRIEVQLPWLLAQIAEKAKGMIQKQGQLMLEKK
jgi:hypothetical protein